MKRKLILYVITNILIVVLMSLITYKVMKYPIHILIGTSLSYILGSMMITAVIYKMFGNRYGKKYKYMLGIGILLTGTIFTLYLSANEGVSELVKNVSNMISIILFMSCIYFLFRLIKYSEKK